MNKLPFLKNRLTTGVSNVLSNYETEIAVALLSKLGIKIKIIVLIVIFL